MLNTDNVNFEETSQYGLVHYCPICGNKLSQLPKDCLGLFCVAHSYCYHCSKSFHIGQAGDWYKIEWLPKKLDKH